MSLKKFGRSDIIRNAMRAYPHSSFFIYDSRVYYDHKPIESGQFNSDILSASGGLSLFEYNVDRSGSTSIVSDPRTATERKTITGPNSPIIPYVYKGSNRQFLKASPRNKQNIEKISDAFASAGGTFTIFTGSTYPATASITRELMDTAGGKTTYTDGTSYQVPNHRHRS